MKEKISKKSVCQAFSLLSDLRDCVLVLQRLKGLVGAKDLLAERFGKRAGEVPVNIIVGTDGAPGSQVVLVQAVPIHMLVEFLESLVADRWGRLDLMGVEISPRDMVECESLDGLFADERRCESFDESGGCGSETGCDRDACEAIC